MPLLSLYGMWPCVPVTYQNLLVSFEIPGHVTTNAVLVLQNINTGTCVRSGGSSSDSWALNAGVVSVAVSTLVRITLGFSQQIQLHITLCTAWPTPPSTCIITIIIIIIIISRVAIQSMARKLMLIQACHLAHLSIFCLSGGWTVEKWLIGSGCRLGLWVGSVKGCVY